MRLTNGKTTYQRYTKVPEQGMPKREEYLNLKARVALN